MNQQLVRIFLTLFVFVCSIFVIAEVIIATHFLVSIPVMLVEILLIMKIWGAP